MNSMIKFNGNRANLLFPELPSLFDDFVTRDFFNLPSARAFNTHTVPAVNVKETSSAYELSVAAPGMDKKDFKLQVEKDKLIISVQHENKFEDNGEDGKYSRKEFSYQSFSREFSLPENSVNEDEISASYKEGILHIVVPKKEQVQTKAVKEIAVN